MFVLLSRHHTRALYLIIISFVSVTFASTHLSISLCEQSAVNAAIDVLGLVAVADSPIGDPLMGGLSNELRKKITIAVELVRSPTRTLSCSCNLVDGFVDSTRQVYHCSIYTESASCPHHGPASSLFLVSLSHIDSTHQYVFSYFYRHYSPAGDESRHSLPRRADNRFGRIGRARRDDDRSRIGAAHLGHLHDSPGAVCGFLLVVANHRKCVCGGSRERYAVVRRNICGIEGRV